jgi:cell filamentation protein
MKKSGRYDVSHLEEAQFEPGSRGRVLKNKPGIKSKRRMDILEKQELLRTHQKLIVIYDNNHSFTAADICKIHKIWLNRIYEWAGKYRQVNISKEDFHFAASAQIPKLMESLEKKTLYKYTPCNFNSLKKVAKALAVVHTELVLIHPFREGNGRIARLLSDLMAAQAGLPPLDFAGIAGSKKREYIAALHAGMDHNYDLMEKIFRYVIRRTLRTHGQRR